MNINVTPIKVLVREKYFYNLNKNIKTYREGYIFGACSIRNSALLFHVYLNNGAIFYRLPISAFCFKPYPEQSVQELEWWDAFGYDVEFIQYSFLKEFEGKVQLKNNKIYNCKYIGTFDWGNILDKNDYTLTETPDQHKCLHFLALDNGNFALAPNNKIIWDDSFFKSDFKIPKKWKIQQQNWTSESKNIILSNNYFYGIRKK